MFIDWFVSISKESGVYIHRGKQQLGCTCSPSFDGYASVGGFLVCGKLSHICNSQMKFLEMSSNGELTNHNLFG
jgi:hypothetical protein